jgi:predicted TIM-barrel fold metal-dependent hydrolase
MGASYRIVSADTHILEPPDVWSTWLPAKYQDKAPQLVSDADGGSAWLFAGATEPDPIGLTATPGMPFDKFRWTGVTYDEARPGCYDGAERLKDMDVDGVDAEILFPPQRTIGHFLGDDDDEFVLAGIDAYNNFVWEQFSAPDRDRLVGMAQIPSIGIDVSVDYLRKAKARGFKGVVISNWPSGGDAISDEDDPFWAAAQDEGMVVCNHINMFSRRQRQSVRVAARKAAERAAGAGTTILGRTGAKAQARAVGGLGGVFGPATTTISNLIFTGVFERFPGLHVSMIEIGIGWVPHFLEQMDDKYWRNRSWGQLPIGEPPSYYWRRNMSATFITDRVGITLRHEAGVDNIMWSTDYPHHGNDWPYSRRVIDETMASIPADEKAKIIAGNAVRIFKLGQ